jgi:hypothetical protein
MVNVDDGIADAKARCLRLGHSKRDGDCGIARTAAGLHRLRRGEANRMANRSLKEGEPSAEGTVREVVKTVCCTQVEVSEREEGHEREKSVLEACGSLEHRRLDAW